MVDGEGAAGFDLTLHLHGADMPDDLCSVQHAMDMALLAAPTPVAAHVDALATAIVLNAKAALSRRQIARLTSHIMRFGILPFS